MDKVKGGDSKGEIARENQGVKAMALMCDLHNLVVGKLPE